MDKEKIEEAKEVLKNCISDYVIGDYCACGHCIDETMCKDTDCPFELAIETILQYIDELEKDLKLEKEWRIRLDNENQYICNIVNNDFIRKSKVIELINKLEQTDGLEDEIIATYMKKLIKEN